MAQNSLRTCLASATSLVKIRDIAFVDGTVLTVGRPKGHFIYKDIPLDAGENLFSAVSTDSSGNLSQPADEISITFETGPA